MPATGINWPSKATQLYWASKSQKREPLVSGVFGFVDGKNLRVQEPSCWLHSVFVTGVFCFGLDGTIIWGRHNCPGSWNDREMSRRLQELLDDGSRVAPGMKLASDSAFPVGGLALGRIVTPLKQGDLERYPTECRLGLQTMSDCITSISLDSFLTLLLLLPPFELFVEPFFFALSSAELRLAHAGATGALMARRRERDLVHLDLAFIYKTGT
ncbi:hypothetical protein DYB38_013816 [Aphanomyces astaci]|uniref:DDE Tnp4 domain-containing protein n=1 Tax=Aphanomyces astaci TaxID=112090 RepID=A0A397EAI0_APHAT|nr:hypothetical protein DYB38_013816 [Aphanomyces astaci]